jgi:hypothetical protein
MSNVTAPLMSLAQSLHSLSQKMAGSDERRHRVLAAEINAYSLAMAISSNRAQDMVKRIYAVTNKVAMCDPTDDTDFEQTMSEAVALLSDLS